MPCRSSPAHKTLSSRLRAVLGAVVLGSLGAVGCANALAQPAPTQAGAPFGPVQLDQILAPIALYPDGLLGQILMAATYPLDIVEADRWLQDPDNAALRGAQLVQALQSQSWDPSVKSLVAFPQVLGVLDVNLDWTEQLGEAFLSQQRDVMDHVQQLRTRAQAARNLVPTPQQQVSTDGQAIEIAPSNPDTVFVPVYDPNLAYGNWPYPDASPFEFDMGGYFPGTFVAFLIPAPLWGWDQWDWRNHGLTIISSGSMATGVSGRPPLHHIPWRYDPAHRGAVRYTSARLQARFGGPRGVAALPADAGSNAFARASAPGTGARGARQVPAGGPSDAPRNAERTAVARSAEVSRSAESPGVETHGAGTGHVSAPAPRPAPAPAQHNTPPALDRPMHESPPRAFEEHAGDAREGPAGTVRDRR